MDDGWIVYRKNHKKQMELIVNSSFSETPGLRYCNLSDKSGEEFYHSLLNESFKESVDKNEVLMVILDYTDGMLLHFWTNHSVIWYRILA